MVQLVVCGVVHVDCSTIDDDPFSLTSHGYGAPGGAAIPISDSRTGEAKDEQETQRGEDESVNAFELDKVEFLKRGKLSGHRHPCDRDEHAQHPRVDEI